MSRNMHGVAGQKRKSRKRSRAQQMRILLVEDEEKVASFIRKGLEQSAYSVHWVRTGEEACEEARFSNYDAILLDLMLPGIDGFQVIRNLRQSSCTIPVIALSARSALDDRVSGLDAGCDDYLSKPFAFEELLARLRALMRIKDGRTSHVLSYGGIIIEPIARRVTRDGRAIHLTNREYALLMLFMREPGRVLYKL
jgi:DNA-binding response OmpR family regulator